jgi:hypothetical protein
MQTIAHRTEDDMRTAALLAAIILATAAQQPAAGPTTCAVGQGHTYMCGALPAPVPGKWFRAHCKAYDGGATCDEAYAGPGPSKKDAARVSHRQRLKTFGIAAAGVGVLVICAVGGGCGFMGG